MSVLDVVGDSALPIQICSGEGALLWDTDGRSYWDLYGGHAVTLLGQGHPAWVDAIAAQARQLSFFTGIGPVPIRQKAASRLCAFTGMDRVFFVNSGAEANEAALKIARKATGRSVVVAMEGGFHGRSMGALGVTWGYRNQHAPAHGEVRFVPFGDADALAMALDTDVAGVILEPVQGIAGVVVPPAGYLAEVARLTRDVGAVLIADEVQCGMGRMGVPLVSLSQGVQPDLVTVGKGVGGGFPVAALLTTEAMAKTVKPGEHGTTFGGGPMACAAVDVTLRLLESEMLGRAQQVGQWVRTHLAGHRLRGDGAWFGLTLDVPAKAVAAALLEAGFLVGTSADPHTLRLAPPAVIPEFAIREFALSLSRILSLRKLEAA